ncbi:unnamed protein product [Nesidiocoris tenuis]|uniref:Cytosol aminopeptidase domain-containing protein n=1 Tax=Nesidiocoris tenuis TaxID=355587 RepID=A0A6H5HDV0_9HEMI|nr:unnamed protein product [Nesidiocoris tenuis]CAB0015453.1 unnamed protein product [Nesidiocoris tenuis]
MSSSLSVEIDNDLHDSGAVLPVDLPAKRLIYSPTVKINSDYHDVRAFQDAAKKGIHRVLARDIGGPDPERMTPKNVETAVRAAFPPESGIKLEVITDEATLSKEYPLYAAVNRAAASVDRHKGRIIYLTYEGSSPQQTLLIVGKGVTYDTGGADIKTGGFMAGMCRDKCGAAAVAGFMKVLSILKPAHLKVIGAMSMVRNSCGEESYVADEIIMSRAGKRVRVVNTDAEGRMIMADVLCKMSEVALKEKNPQLFTIATLTGHAGRTVGEGYSYGLDSATPLAYTHVDIAASSGSFPADATGAPILAFATAYLGL